MSGEPNELRKVIWGEESTCQVTPTEASMWEKQAWGADASTHWLNSKSPRIGKWMSQLPSNDLEIIGSTYPEVLNPHHNRVPDIIRETQPIFKSQGSVYKDILASIGLDSPNTSSDSRRE